MIIEGTVIRVDIHNAAPAVFDMAEIFRLEARKQEIVSVTKANAGSLLRALEEGYAASGQMLAEAAHRLTQVQLAMKRREAFMMLEEIPKMLQEKGLATARSPGGSENMRNAALELDAEIAALKDAEGALTSVKARLSVINQGFQMSFTATKRVIDQQGGGFTPSFATPITPKY